MEGYAPSAVQHSGLPYPAGDDDYTFDFIVNSTAAPLSVNGADGLHVEFDSDETIDNFTSPEWQALHQAVDNDAARATLLFASESPSPLPRHASRRHDPYGNVWLGRRARSKV